MWMKLIHSIVCKSGEQKNVIHITIHSKPDNIDTFTTEERYLVSEY